MDEHQYRRFQAAMLVVSTIGAVIVFFVGLQRYHAEQADLIQKRVEAEEWARHRDFRRELWLRQFDMLSKVAGTASRIAAMVDEGELTAFDAAVQEYEQLYWGNIAFVDDPDLVRTMDALRHEIRYFRDGLEPVDGLTAAHKVKQKAYSVALACRVAIHKTGEEYLPIPDAKKP